MEKGAMEFPQGAQERVEDLGSIMDELKNLSKK